MQCPSCLHDMRAASEKPSAPYNGHREDVYCINPKCKARVEASYTNHMGTLHYRYTGPWGLCNSYHFVFQAKGQWYVLVGEPNELPGTPVPLYGAENWEYKKTYLYKRDSKEPIVEVDFVPISVYDDDMHLEAERLFIRLISLTAFA